ncbi:MAG: glycosyltransferase [Myxococcales bacterium]|nr:MAG: glycosyltransferase [Myxococcales bacterium]
MSFETLTVLFAAIVLAQVWWSHRLLSRAAAAGQRPKRLSHYPAVSVIRPIKGLDSQARQNLEAALDSGYPGPVETIFVFDGPNEPAYPLALEVVERHRESGRPGTAKVIFCGEPPEGRTGKLNAMIAGLSQARGELIAFADSDTRPGRESLARLVEMLLSSPKAGSAFAPVVVTTPPKTVGDAGYALLLNGLYGSVAALTAARNNGELSFIMGQFMVLKRESLAAIGGLESATGQFVDDMYLGARIRAAGLSNLVSPGAVPIIQEGLSFGEFWRIYVRWIAFSRSGLPDWSFKLPAIAHGVILWLGVVGLLAGGILGFWLPAACAAPIILAVSASINNLHRAHGGSPLKIRHWWVSSLLLLMAPLVFANVYWRREVEWRGRSYKLDHESRLAEDDPADKHGGSRVETA